MRNSKTTYTVGTQEIALTEAAKQLFCDYYTDRGNWADVPLVGGNVSQGYAENALLTDLKQKGILTTQEDEGNVWIYFTAIAEGLYRAICEVVATKALNNVADALDGTEIGLATKLEEKPTTTKLEQARNRATALEGDLALAMKCIEAQRTEIDELKKTPEAQELRQLKSDRETLVYETKKYDRLVTSLKASVSMTERKLKHVRADRRDLTAAVVKADKQELAHVATIEELTQTIERMLASKAVAGLKASSEKCSVVLIPSEIVTRVAHTKLGPGGDFTRELTD